MTSPSPLTSPLSPGLISDLQPAIDTVRSALDGRSVALAQEWIGSRAGSEKVFEALAAILPEADLFTLTHTAGVEIETGGRPIETSFLDGSPLHERRSLSLPLMPMAWRRLRQRDSREWDVVVTSAHALGRSFGRRAPVHLSYVHSPARYIWFPDVDSRTGRFTAQVQAPARALLKRVDASATRTTTSLAANSETTRARIAQAYGRSSELIHPPVDTRFYTLGPRKQRSGLLALGRLIPYKRMDVAIEIADRVSLPLTIVGRGPDAQRLRELAAHRGVDVTFVEGATDDEVRELYRRSEALVFPGNEDFGIVPVEAQACGCPVVTAGVGGALETVVGGVTGVHARSEALEDLVVATRVLLDSSLDPAACREQAERFSYATFGSAVATWVSGALDE